MKAFVLALTVSVLGLSATQSYATDDFSTTEETVVQIDADAEFAKVDDAIFCSVAMVNRRNRIIRRYNGTRNLRSFRCERPMRQCRQDLRFGRRLAARCVELRQ